MVECKTRVILPYPNEIPLQSKEFDFMCTSNVNHSIPACRRMKHKTPQDSNNNFWRDVHRIDSRSTILFELRHQLCLFDYRTRRIALLAKGYGATAAIEVIPIQ